MLYYFTRELFGRSFQILNDPTGLSDEEKGTFADAVLLTLLYGPHADRIWAYDEQAGIYTADKATADQAAMELFGIDLGAVTREGAAEQADEADQDDATGRAEALILEVDGTYQTQGYSFSDNRPEAVVTGIMTLDEKTAGATGFYYQILGANTSGFQAGNTLLIGETCITRKGTWLSSQNYVLALQPIENGTYSDYQAVSMFLRWNDPEDCMTTQKAGFLKEELDINCFLNSELGSVDAMLLTIQDNLRLVKYDTPEHVTSLAELRRTPDGGYEILRSQTLGGQAGQNPAAELSGTPKAPEGFGTQAE